MKHIVKGTSPATIRRLALLSLLGIALYIVLDILLFFLRPDLSILHTVESDYGNGPWAWIMDSNFLLRCILSLAVVGALWNVLPRSKTSRSALRLLAVWAIASGVLAFFSDDYEGTPATTHGTVHLIAAGIAFLCCLLATLLLTVVLVRLWRKPTIVGALIVIWLSAALGLGLFLNVVYKPGALDGLYERLFLGSTLLWLGVVMGYLYSLSEGTPLAIDTTLSSESEEAPVKSERVPGVNPNFKLVVLASLSWRKYFLLAGPCEATSWG